MSYNARHWDTHDPCTGMKAAKASAERGSDQLRWAMRREFMGFAMKHNVTFKDAKLLLMNGEGLA